LDLPSEDSESSHKSDSDSDLEDYYAELGIEDEKDYLRPDQEALYKKSKKATGKAEK